MRTEKKIIKEIKRRVLEEETIAKDPIRRINKENSIIESEEVTALADDIVLEKVWVSYVALKGAIMVIRKVKKKVQL